MSADRSQWAAALEAYRDGTIDDATAVALAQALRRPDAEGDWLRSQIAVMGLLAQAGDDSSAEQMVASFRERRAATGTSVRFAKRVRRRRTRRPTRMWWPVPLAAALFFVVFALLRPVTPSAVADLVVTSAGTVEVDGVLRSLTPEEPLALRDGSSVQVTVTAMLTRRDEATAFALAPGTRATLARQAAALTVHTGHITATVAPQADQRTVTVATSHLQVRVIGTAFTVVAQPQTSLVEVHAGVVAVTLPDGSDEQRLTAGHGALAQAGDRHLVRLGAGRRWHVAPGDEGGDGSMERPFARIAPALAAINPGDTVLIHPGVYDCEGTPHAALSLDRGGASGKPVTIRGMPGSRPLLRSRIGAGLQITGAASHVHIIGLEFAHVGLAGEQGKGNGIRIAHGPQHVTIEDCTVRGFGGAGISVNGSHFLSLVNNRIIGNGAQSTFADSGISVFSFDPIDPAAGSFVRIIGNHVFGTRSEQVTPRFGAIVAGHGIALGSMPTGVTVTLADNICVDNSGSGISLMDCAQVELLRNICWRNQQRSSYTVGEWDLRAIGLLRAAGNIVVAADGKPAAVFKTDGQVLAEANWWVGLRSDVFIGPGDRSESDPSFIAPDRDPDRADFRLQPGSSAPGFGPR